MSYYVDDVGCGCCTDRIPVRVISEFTLPDGTLLVKVTRDSPYAFGQDDAWWEVVDDVKDQHGRPYKA